MRNNSHSRLSHSKLLFQTLMSECQFLLIGDRWMRIEILLAAMCEISYIFHRTFGEAM